MKINRNITKGNLFWRKIPIGLVLSAIFVVFTIGFSVAGLSGKSTLPKKELYLYCQPMSVNGECGAKHLQCVQGTAVDDPEDDSLYYRWTCVGGSNGIPEQCREAKDQLVSKSNPPTMVRECRKSFMGWWDWCSVVSTAQYVYSIFLGVFGSVATLVVMYGGILYITSGGD